MYFEFLTRTRNALRSQITVRGTSRFPVRFPALATVAMAVLLALLSALQQQSRAAGAESDKAEPEARIRIDDGHPWRPPFGVQRVGRPLTAVVEIATQRQPAHEYSLVAFLRGKEISRSVLELTGQAPFSCRVTLNPWPTQLVLLAQPAEGGPIELVRKTIEPATWEADAVARPDTIINPIDLGTILVPSDWLLLSGSQSGWIEGAAICRSDNLTAAGVTAWFSSTPANKSHIELALTPDRRSDFRLPLPAAPADRDRDTLHVSIDTASGEQVWHKEIRTMLVQRPPQWPQFGAVETKLRYDAPISVRADDGSLLVDELRPGMEAGVARRCGRASQRFAVRVLARFKLRAVLGRPM